MKFNIGNSKTKKESEVKICLCEVMVFNFTKLSNFVSLPSTSEGLQSHYGKAYLRMSLPNSFVFRFVILSYFHCFCVIFLATAKIKFVKFVCLRLQ